MTQGVRARRSSRLVPALLYFALLAQPLSGKGRHETLPGDYRQSKLAFTLTVV
jgi:hypothetical protein